MGIRREWRKLKATYNVCAESVQTKVTCKCQEKDFVERGNNICRGIEVRNRNIPGYAVMHLEFSILYGRLGKHKAKEVARDRLF